MWSPPQADSVDVQGYWCVCAVFREKNMFLVVFSAAILITHWQFPLPGCCLILVGLVLVASKKVRSRTICGLPKFKSYLADQASNLGSPQCTLALSSLLLLRGFCYDLLEVFFCEFLVFVESSSQLQSPEKSEVSHCPVCPSAVSRSTLATDQCSPYGLFETVIKC